MKMEQGQADGENKDSLKNVKYYCRNVLECPLALADNSNTDAVKVYTNSMVMELLRNGHHTDEGYPTCPACGMQLKKDASETKLDGMLSLSLYTFTF